MRKFSMPSIEVKNFSRVSILTDSNTGTNMSAATNALASITINGKTASINDSSIAKAALK